MRAEGRETRPNNRPVATANPSTPISASMADTKLAARPLGALGMAPWGTILDARRLPARYLRREFAITKKVKRATAYVSGLGFFDLSLNGAKVSENVMDPALSDYAKATYVVTFDVTNQLHMGANALGVILGNGRFYPPRLEIPAHTTAYGCPRLLLQLEIEYEDGTRSAVISDETWRLTAQGPIRANSEYDGEEYGWKCRVGIVPGSTTRSGSRRKWWQLRAAR